MIHGLSLLACTFASPCIGHKSMVRVGATFALIAPTLASLKMMNTLLILHPSDIDSPCLDSLLDF